MAVNRESLARHNQATRDALLDAMLALLDDGPERELTFDAIARRARVSLRTVFRHFPSQAALRVGVVPRIAARLAHVGPPERVEELAAYVDRLYRVCEAQSGLVRALVTTRFGRGLLLEERARRLALLERLLARAAPTVAPRRRRQAAATIRYLASGAAWEFYRHQAGLPLADAIAAATAGVLAAAGSVATRRAPRRRAQD